MHDMTKGSAAKELLFFTLSMLLSIVFQQLYNIADSVVAGRFIGQEGLAAVGASYPVTMIFMAVATGCNIGCSVTVSQLFGARDFRQVKSAISTSLISVLTLSLLLTGAGLYYCQTMLRMLSTPDNIFNQSALYLNVYIGGLFFLFLYNISTGIFNALGDSKTPLYFLIASSVSNIILDILFVTAFHMGVGGVAWATFICQGAASLMAAFTLFVRLKKIPHTDRYEIFSGHMLGRISRIAIPSILQQSFISVGNLMIQGLVNTFGSAVIAGYAAAIKLNTFALTSFSTLSNGVSAFSAQNIGANKPDRVKTGFRAGLSMAACVVVPAILLFQLAPKQMIGIFLNQEESEAIQAGISFLTIVSPFYLAIAVKLIADGVLRGSGAMGAFMTATFTDLILRVGLAFVLAPIYGSSGIWMSWPLGWVLGAALSYWFYKRGSWKKCLPGMM